jgi:hypothetical protein
MPVNPALAITIPASSPLYRITAISFHTPNPVHHKKVVNGMGARKSHNGARYNFGGVITVYLADTVETCLAEKMFYFHRETVRRLDALHLPLIPSPENSRAPVPRIMSIGQDRLGVGITPGA